MSNKRRAREIRGSQPPHQAAPGDLTTGRHAAPVTAVRATAPTRHAPRRHAKRRGTRRAGFFGGALRFVRLLVRVLR